MIVTDNLRDFPDTRLARWDMEARSADHFMHAMVDLAPKQVVGVRPHVSLGVRPDVSFPRRTNHGIGGSGGVRNRSLSR